MLIEHITNFTITVHTFPVFPSAGIDIPPIGVDWNAPFMSSLRKIASWVLTGALVVVFILLVVAIAAIAGRRLAPERMQAWAGENVVWIGLTLALLGSVGGLFGFFVNFDLGFA